MATKKYTKDNPSNKRAYQRAYNKRHREERTAKQWVRRQIERGKMERQPCEDCGSPDSYQYHEDYSKPENVQWFCRKCVSQTKGSTKIDQKMKEWENNDKYRFGW